ncbi:unnamed protein product [Dibothriocephalus latus]|uniref:Dynein light chain n=1 Tax=Dibothriocephalus latus TaxID=60516 RepID=A0A3P7QRT3_DIBLA|nr:unnamed protein product [Dibothriocephalus latus]
MSKEMEELAAKVALSAVLNFKVEKDMAAYLKKEFERINGETWHCIVGKDFGSYVTHVKGGFIYLYVDDLAFLLYKTV